MKIGILTFCNAYNLGGALQAYSLWKTMEETGADAELIDYRCPAIESMHQLRPVLKSGVKAKARVYNLLHNIVFSKRRGYYKEFQKEMRRSRPYTPETIAETNGVYDVFVTGSDQVFNFSLTGNDSAYFLDFVKKGTKASYAASLGTYLPEKKEEYRRLLEPFDSLSVREKSSQTLLSEELGIDAQVMPDPVFLHTGDEWKKLTGVKDEEVREKYVLVYSLVEDKKLYREARFAAEKYGLKIYVITKVLRPLGKADKYLRNVGPKQFIGLIANADYVVTNSFHGTAFSLIFKKRFSVVLPPRAQSRIVDLLEDLGAGNRIVNEEEKEPLCDDGADSARIEAKLAAMRAQGIAYLKRLQP